MSDIRQVDDSGRLVEQSQTQEVVEQPKNAVSAPALPEMEVRAAAQVMGLEGETEINKHEPQLKTLLEWAKAQNPKADLTELKWIIRSLELKLGTPPLSEKRINYMSRYAFLQMEKSKIDREMEQYNPWGEA